MNVAIMQPYLFPYIGYFQLIKSVDVFVIFDDVSYINRGWVNRNRILLNGKDHLFTLPLEKASQNRLINELNISEGIKNKKKLLMLMSHAYARAPQYEGVRGLLEDMIMNKENNISRYIEYTLKKFSIYFGLDTKFITSSKIKKINHLKGQQKIIAICKHLSADTYINSIGGTELYNKDDFKKENIKLFFLKPKPIRYLQFRNEFVPNLSVIDTLMFNTNKEIIPMLNEFLLI